MFLNLNDNSVLLNTYFYYSRLTVTLSVSLSEPEEAPTGVTTTVMNSTARVKWNEAQNVRGLLLGYKVPPRRTSRARTGSCSFKKPSAYLENRCSYNLQMILQRKGFSFWGRWTIYILFPITEQQSVTFKRTVHPNMKLQSWSPHQHSDGKSGKVSQKNSVAAFS